MEHGLPPKQYFLSKLRNEDINPDLDCPILNKNFNFAHEVYKCVNARNLEEYMHFYLKVDVLLLAAVFHNYRVSIYDVYHLDPSQFVTAPSLALQAALFASKESISLISDIDIYSLFENSVRGGFVSVVKNRVLLNNS